MDEIAATTPTFRGVSYARLDELGSIQWPCNDEAPEGTPIMHVDRFVRGKGQFMLTEYVPTEERVGPRFPLLLTTGRILSQYNVGAQTRRTENVTWHAEDVSRSIPSTPSSAGSSTATSSPCRAGRERSRSAPGSASGCSPGVVYTTFHHPATGANVVTTDNSDWATNCPEYKVTAVQVRRTNALSAWQIRIGKRRPACAASRGRSRCRRVKARRPSSVEARAVFYDGTAPGLAARARGRRRGAGRDRRRRLAIRGDDGDAR